MNCKTIKDIGCESCDDKMLCKTYLNLKMLDEYDDTEPIGFKKRVAWDNECRVIATIKRNPILGIEVETNVVWSSIPEEKRNVITNWANTKGDQRLRDGVDAVGIVRTF